MALHTMHCKNYVQSAHMHAVSTLSICSVNIHAVYIHALA
jgi:hypothetical protein